MARIKDENEHWPSRWYGKLTEAQVKQYDGDFWAVRVDDEETFHLGQVYANEAVRLIKCGFCGGTDFNVGTGDYYTVLRCKNCEWEECIHDG